MMVTQGHVTVNGRLVNIPSYLVRTGDVIRVKNRPKSVEMVQARMAEHTARSPISWRGRRSAGRGTRTAAARGRRRFHPRSNPVDRGALFQIEWGPAAPVCPQPQVLDRSLPMRIRWRGLELPSQVSSERATLSATYGKFSAEPFERGFGVTIGNSLRRVLLSSLEGSAVTQIKLHGAQHEFSTLPGIVEDGTDIVLNVKSLVVKNYSDQTRVVRIEKNTAARSPAPTCGPTSRSK